MRSVSKTTGQVPAAPSQAVGDRESFIEAARRVQIVSCAIETIAELGLAQASLAKIAARAGISKGLISYHFQSKDDLIRHVVETVYTAGAAFMVPRLKDSKGATEVLRAYVRSDVAFLVANPVSVRALSEIFSGWRKPDGTMQVDPGSADPVLQPLQSILRSGQRSGEFRRFDVRHMALAIRSGIDAVGALLFSQPEMDFAAYGSELAEAFVRATRKDP